MGGEGTSLSPVVRGSLEGQILPFLRGPPEKRNPDLGNEVSLYCAPYPFPKPVEADALPSTNLQNPV